MPHIRDIFLGQGVPEPYRSNRTNITDNNMFGRTTPELLSASTKKLFQAIDDESLEAFEQAIAEGADVNAFDEGCTPLMTIIISNGNSPICLKMMILLLQHQDLNVNIQEPKENNTALHLAFRMENRNFVQMLLRNLRADTGIRNKVFLLKDKYLDPGYDQVRVYIAEEYYYQQCFFYTPQEYIEKIGKVQGKDFSHLTVEIQKAQKGKQLLTAFAEGGFCRAKTLLNQELNPNCWRRNQNGEIETPLSLIVGLCSEGITENKKEVLTKLLKHKELDFSQIKPIQNKELKLFVELTIKERLTDTINRKDLDDVKKLVEDNCFIRYAIVAAALRGIDDLTEPIEKYLNEKFPVSVGQSLSEGFKQAFQDIAIELESVQAQLAEKEKDLKQAEQEKVDQQAKITQLTNENAQLRAQNQDLKNKKSLGIGAPGGRHNNYALTFFILSRTFVVGACLTIVDYPEISAGLAAVALGLF